MALLPHLSERGRAGLVLGATLAGAIGVIASGLRGDWVSATLIAVVVAALVAVWAWTRRRGEE